MTWRGRRTTRLALAALLVACAPQDEPVPTPSASESPTSSATPTPTAPTTRADIPVNCLNVVTEEYRDAVAAMGVSLQSMIAQVGLGATGNGEPVEMRRSMACILSGDQDADPAYATERIHYGEFDAADREEVLAHYEQSVGASAEPSSTIDDAMHIVGEAFSAGTTVVTVGPDWMLLVQTSTGLTDVALELPDATVTGDEVDAAHPPTQTCETMLPVPTPELDWSSRYAIGSVAVSSLDEGLWTACASTCEDDVCDHHPGDAAPVWWEESDAASVEALLADAEEGVDGLGLGGSTVDGEGTLVTTDGDEVLVVFDAAIVHVQLPDGMEQGVQIARLVHDPGWLDLPPAA